ncbi:hypothetical protein [Occallatibacter riparius]|uniref:Uncharacterized protein n=1 Tax=Occallatibacter riparius TaxID=1002689 RepID=A0A9J7BNZ5_9BACT|nr:hypothetical protein [Occallatibacter riparius]UWZ84440.1 hypothetical protein MOP44_00555 [Occallatibacter riparius]
MRGARIAPRQHRQRARRAIASSLVMIERSDRLIRELDRLLTSQRIERGPICYLPAAVSGMMRLSVPDAHGV